MQSYWTLTKYWDAKRYSELERNGNKRSTKNTYSFIDSGNNCVLWTYTHLTFEVTSFYCLLSSLILLLLSENSIKSKLCRCRRCIYFCYYIALETGRAEQWTIHFVSYIPIHFCRSAEHMFHKPYRNGHILVTYPF